MRVAGCRLCELFVSFQKGDLLAASFHLTFGQKRPQLGYGQFSWVKFSVLVLILEREDFACQKSILKIETDIIAPPRDIQQRTRNHYSPFFCRPNNLKAFDAQAFIDVVISGNVKTQ